MKAARHLPLAFWNQATGEEVRCPILIVSPDDDSPQDGDALHEMTRSEAAELLRLWRRKGRPFRERSPEPLINAVLWRTTELLKVEPEGEA
jgi:hypothetical protein